jgi:hypothetical protein
VDSSYAAQAVAVSVRTVARLRRMTADQSLERGIGSSHQQSALWAAANHELNHTGRTTVSPLVRLGVVRAADRSTAAGSHAQR